MVLLCLAAVASLVLLAAGPPVASAREAYVTDFGADTVTPVDLATATAAAPIPVGSHPDAIAITPDGSRAYVVNGGGGTVSVIDTQTNQVVGPPISVGSTFAEGIAIAPDGLRAYVTHPKGVAVIDTQTNQLVGTIKLPGSPFGFAIAPDGRTAYVGNAAAGTVSVIDLQTDQVTGSAIKVGEEPLGIAITPDGTAAYVANGNSESVSVIDTATGAVEGPAIKVGKEPGSIAITPNGAVVYVANVESDSISVIDVASNKVVGSIASESFDLAMAPNGRTLYTTRSGTGTLTPIDVGSGRVGTPIPSGEESFGVAIVPQQTPRPAFSVPVATAGSPAIFDASASTDPGGAIASYSWSFGDGQTATGGPVVSHTFALPGSYRVTLTVDDGEGCPRPLFTGQTAFCTGPSTAGTAQTVTVAPAPAAALPPRAPRVRVSCPRSAKAGGCRFALQVVSGKPRRIKGRLHRPKPESAVARVKLAAGHSALVTLTPKPKFAARLEAAAQLLVREVETAKGSTHTSYRRLRVVR
ncbi:MAG TPA: PKD domain-containing protein [Solirubrobacterales bacterium]|jgi:YVTN family beta-propeller protein